MKKKRSFWDGVWIGGLIFGLLGLFIGAPLQIFSQPHAVIRNTATSPVRVELRSNKGALYELPDLVPQTGERIALARRDQTLNATCLFPNGRTLKSEDAYILNNRSVLFVRVTNDAVWIDVGF
jgi:hypothetical protein